ncbi:hypothetical protein CASFOL_032402 [Castilleja foliolosa]|uniref:Subtilisin-like protease n=1 Tax=Castilleja foliolosa TaxID=1961234 RepID=A0ABD3C1F5_9LAMI
MASKPLKSEAPSTRDSEGHGTHTASTAAGAIVPKASLYGYASGNASGMAPGARLAIYKVCWIDGCASSDILAAMDSTIDDGVDVLSMSIGGGRANYYLDEVAIGAFAAMEKGIVVSCSAGNSGPFVGSLANVAPWILTVGAVYNTSGSSNMSCLCIEGSLSRAAVEGKVVLCDRGVNARVEKGEAVKAAGGVGMILANSELNGEELTADSHVLPAVAMGMKAGVLIRNYVTNTKNPTVVLSFGGTVLNVKPSPVVAAFSSRGPNLVTPEILKPD